MDKYKNVIIKGYSFPDVPIKTNLKAQLNASMKIYYLPALERVTASKGVKLLATIMAQKEGFFKPSTSYPKGSRSYRFNNPGNIGNTDSGNNNAFPTLADGIRAQISYIERVGNGTHPAHKFGKRTIKPFYSKEIADNQKTYGISPWLPGYEFDYKGQLGAFVKIYSTGARGGNSYLSMIISYFAENGIKITENTTISEICAIN